MYRKRVNVYIYVPRVAPDQDLAGYPANFFAGYPVSGWIFGLGQISGSGRISGKKNTKKNFYLNLEFYIVILFVAQLFYFLLV